MHVDPSVLLIGRPRVLDLIKRKTLSKLEHPNGEVARAQVAVNIHIKVFGWAQEVVLPAICQAFIVRSEVARHERCPIEGNSWLRVKRLVRHYVKKFKAANTLGVHCCAIAAGEGPRLYEAHTEVVLGDIQTGL